MYARAWKYIDIRTRTPHRRKHFVYIVYIYTYELYTNASDCFTDITRRILIEIKGGSKKMIIQRKCEWKLLASSRAADTNKLYYKYNFLYHRWARAIYRFDGYIFHIITAHHHSNSHHLLLQLEHWIRFWSIRSCDNVRNLNYCSQKLKDHISIHISHQRHHVNIVRSLCKKPTSAVFRYSPVQRWYAAYDVDRHSATCN